MQRAISLRSFFTAFFISIVLFSPEKFFLKDLQALIHKGLSVYAFLGFNFFLGWFYAVFAVQKSNIKSLISLIETGEELGTTVNYERIFHLLRMTTRSLFRATFCIVYLKDDEGVMKQKGEQDEYTRLFADFDPDIVKSELNQVVLNRCPLIFRDIGKLSEKGEQILLTCSKAIRGGMAVPILFEDETIGLLFVATSTANAYNKESAMLFSVLANQAAVSIQNLRSQEKASEMASTDSVTGLYTHAYMQEVLEQEMRRCKQQNLLFSAIILDLDHFKTINDAYGHPQGDSLLRQLGIVIKGVARRHTDIVCRYGGDELLILLPETDRMSAAVIAERVRKAAESHPFVLGSKVVNITISAGVASSHQAQTPKDLINKADQALYQAKQEGRNKVCVAT